MVVKQNAQRTIQKFKEQTLIDNRISLTDAMVEYSTMQPKVILENVDNMTGIEKKQG